MVKARILAVDDDPMNLAVIEELLGDEYNLLQLERGDAVLEAAKEFQPDLVLLDIMMPGMNGYEVCEQLRATDGLKHLKIMLVSAKAMVEERLLGYKAGADDYVTKPFNLDEFLAKVRVYIRLKSVEEVNELKMGFLDLLNHDTKTPLTSIMAPAELLMANTPMDEDQRKMMGKMILDSAKDLSGLLERVSLWSALKLGQVEIEPEEVELVEIVETEAEAIKAKNPDCELKINLQGCSSIRVLGSRSYLSTVSSTLLDNAVRYSPASGQVEIALQQTSSKAQFSVTDQGPGISPSYLPHVFDPLCVEEPKAHGGRQGLSLALSKAMIEAMNGEISVDSSPGVTTSFTVSLPTAEELRKAA